MPNALTPEATALEKNPLADTVTIVCDQTKIHGRLYCSSKKKRTEYQALLKTLKHTRLFHTEHEPGKEKQAFVDYNAFNRLVELAPDDARTLLEGKPVYIKVDNSSLLHVLLSDTAKGGGKVELANNTFSVKKVPDGTHAQEPPAPLKHHRGGFSQLRRALEVARGKKTKIRITLDSAIAAGFSDRHWQTLKELLAEFEDVMHPIDTQQLLLRVEAGLDVTSTTEVRQTVPLPREEADRLNHDTI